MKVIQPLIDKRHPLKDVAIRQVLPFLNTVLKDEVDDDQVDYPQTMSN